MFVFGTDLVHEGYDMVLDNLVDRAGVDAISLSATYHNARDVFPHNPVHRVYRHEGDISWFIPRPHTYPAGMVAPLAADADGVDVFAQLCERAARRDVEVQAWTIFTHNSRLAGSNPDCASRNAYGDAYLTDLCPANPKVREYAVALCADICRYPVTRLLAESLHYRPFEHGEHHERYLVPIPPAARGLLALCFCAHCRRAGEAAGVDADHLAAAIRAALEPVWAGEPVSVEDDLVLSEVLRAEIDAYVGVRESVVATLSGEVRAAAADAGVELSFIDHAGAMPHVMLGTSAEEPPMTSSRKLGVDLDRVAPACDELIALGYADTPERLAASLGAYRDALGSAAPLACALRPFIPDCSNAENLAAKVAVARAAGVRRVDFYHYAMAPLNRLDWIAAALSNTKPPSTS
jgi:hypothetical protein